MRKALLGGGGGGDGRWGKTSTKKGGSEAEEEHFLGKTTSSERLIIVFVLQILILVKVHVLSRTIVRSILSGWHADERVKHTNTHTTDS